MNLSNNPLLLATPGEKHNALNFDPEYTGKLKKENASLMLGENIEALSKIQDKLYADNRYAVLLIFQALDAAGKDGTIKHVMSGVNPQGCQVFSFKQPSSEELDHDYFWRTYKCLPERGRIGIFNRSYYEEVLVTKVHPQIILGQSIPGIHSVESIDQKFWKQRYRQINDLERQLTENGTVIIKFFLNISKEQQKRRFIKRIDDESKNWKFSVSDLKEREHWGSYMDAFSDMLTFTSTEQAPWYVIPADHKWFMRYAVGQIIVERLSGLNLQYPTISSETREKLLEAKKMLEAEKKPEKSK